jgi:hypothetical protein
MNSMRYEDAQAEYWDVLDCLSQRYVNKVFKARRYICRVCKIKFSTRRDTQAHIKDEHHKNRNLSQ